MRISTGSAEESDPLIERDSARFLGVLNTDEHHYKDVFTFASQKLYLLFRHMYSTEYILERSASSLQFVPSLDIPTIDIPIIELYGSFLVDNSALRSFLEHKFPFLHSKYRKVSSVDFLAMLECEIELDEIEKFFTKLVFPTDIIPNKSRRIEFCHLLHVFVSRRERVINIQRIIRGHLSRMRQKNFKSVAIKFTKSFSISLIRIGEQIDTFFKADLFRSLKSAQSTWYIYKKLRNFDVKYISSKIYVIVDFYNRIMHTRNFFDFSTAMLSFVQNINDMRFSEIADKIFDGAIVSMNFINAWLNIFKEEINNTLRPQGFGDNFAYFISLLKSKKDDLLNIFHIPIINKFMKLMRYFLTSCFAFVCGLDPENVMNYSCDVPKGKLDFIGFASSTLIDFCDGGAQFFIKGNTNNFVHTGKEYKRWSEEVVNLKTLYDHRVSDETVIAENEMKVGYTDFAIRVDRAYMQGKEIAKMTMSHKVKTNEHKIILSTYDGITQLKSKVVSEELTGKNRPQPYANIYYGDPGCGKSHLCKYTLQCVHSIVSDLGWNDDLVYSRVPGSEYEEGYNASKLYEIMDELGAENPNKTTGIPENLKSFLQKINTQPLVVNMPDLERKGKVAYSIKYAVATSNNPNFAAPYFVSPGAFMRRFKTHFDVEVKDEFVEKINKTATGRVDPIKCHDFKVRTGVKAFPWIVTAKNVILTKKQHRKIKFKEVAVIDSHDKMSVYLRGEYRRYKQILAISETDQNDNNLNFCPTCDKANNCECGVRVKPLNYVEPPPTIEAQSNTAEFVEFGQSGMLLLVQSVVTLLGIVWIGDLIIKYVLKPWWVRVTRKTVDTVTKDSFSRVGEKVATNITGFQLAGFLITLLTIFSGLRTNYIPHCDSEEHEDSLPYEDAPARLQSKLVGKDENSFFKPKIYSLNLKCKDGVLRNHVKNRIDSNLKRFFIRPKGVERGMYFLGLGVADHKYLVPWHLVLVIKQKGYDEIREITEDDDVNISPSRRMLVDESSFVKIPGHDMGILTLNGVMAVRNLIKFFPENYPDVGTKTSGFLYTKRRKCGDLAEHHTSIYTERLNADFTGEGMKRISMRHNFGYDGGCISPLVVPVGNTWTIGALHMVGDGQRTNSEDFTCGWAECITRKEILDACHFKFGFPVVQDIERLPMTMESISKVNTEELHHKNITRWMFGCATVHGEEVGVPTPTARTNVRKTLIFDAVDEHYGKLLVAPADLKVGTRAGIYNNPFREGLKHTMMGTVRVPPAILTKACEMYVERLVKGGIGEVDSSLPIGRALTDYEAINGLPGVPFMGGINRKAGGGYGCTKKYKYLIDDIRPGYPNGVNFIPEVYSKLNELRMKLRNGFMVRPTFAANLKNEIRVLKKREKERVETIRTMFHGLSDEEISKIAGVDYNFVEYQVKDARVFMGGPLIWSHEMRRLFLPVMRLLQLDNCLSECAVGMNATSSDWKKLKEFLIKYGLDKLIDGDFSKFDKLQGPELILIAGYVMIMLMERVLKYPEYELRTAHLLVEDLAFPLIFVLFTLLTLAGGLCSGVIVTVSFNSIINSILMRCVWLILELDAEDFDKKVSLMTYGDDNTASSNEPRYNFVSISKTFADLGIKYTRASKQDSERKFIHIDEVSFLKRKFVEDDLGRVLAPLEFESIQKSLCWITDSKLSREEHLHSSIDSAMREIYQHGEVKYNEMRDFLLNLQVCQDNAVEIDPYDILHEKILPHYTKHSVRDFIPQCSSKTDVPVRPKISPTAIAVRPIEPNLHARCDHWTQKVQTELQKLSSVSANGSPRSPYLGKVPAEANFVHPRCEVELNTLSYNRLTTINPNSLAASYKTVDNKGATLALECTRGENVAWNDMFEGSISEVPGFKDPTVTEATKIADLGDILCRPVKITEFTWQTYATTLHGTFEPWKLWSNNSLVADKLRNFRLLRGTMELSFKINGAPTYAGQIIVSWDPLLNLQTLDHVAPVSADSREFTRMRYSQMQHIFLNAATSEGGCMCLPFIWPKNFIRIQESSDFENMGTIGYLDMGEMRNVTSSGPIIPANVEITVFARLKPGYDLQVPIISNLVAQCDQESDEYSNENEGIVSRPAKAISNVASKLVDAPVIGPFAQATQVASGAVADVAKLFGFAQPANIEVPKHMRREPFGSLAYVSGAANVNKLTLDPKQGLTVDPRVTGVDKGDEMTLKSIACRESYIGKFDWHGGDLKGDNLWTCPVTPSLCQESNTLVVGDEAFQMTPMCFVANGFYAWSGTINFRFQIVSTNFNKGRLKITYDPVSKTDSQVMDSFNNSYSTVIDIAASRNVEVPIAWAQDTLYKRCMDSTNLDQFHGPNPSNTLLPEFHNGYLSVQVLNTLPSLTKSSPEDQIITVLVFASAGEDIQFQNPTSGFSGFRHHVTPQSAQDEEEEFPRERLLASTLPYVIENEYGELEVKGSTDGDFENFDKINPIINGDFQSFDRMVNPEEGYHPQMADAFDEQEVGEQTDPMQANDAGVMGGPASGLILYKDLVCYGDPITSLRSLLGRSCYSTVRSWDMNDYPTGINLLTLEHAVPNFPEPVGYDVNAYWTVGGEPFVPGHMTHLAYFSAAYVCRRGGIRHKYAVKWHGGITNTTSIKTPDGCSFSVKRSNNPRGSPVINTTVQSTTSYDPINSYQAAFKNSELEGLHVVSSSSQDALLVEIPANTSVRFYLGQAPSYNGISLDDSDIATHSIRIEQFMSSNNVITKACSIDDYVSAADDFSLTYFNFVPTMYRSLIGNVIDGHV